MNRDLVVAMVGTGFMARTHLAAYKRLPSVKVKYVVGRRPEPALAAAQEVGATAVTSLSAALEDPSVDLIDLTVPTPLHHELTITALRAGKHVIVEKPISLTPDLADEMITTAVEAGRLLMVAHVLRFWPVYERIAAIVKTGRLGRPLLARTYRLASPPKWSAWLSDRAQTGGAAVDLGIHDIDFLNSLFGQPKTVQAWGSKVDDGIALHYVANIEYEGLTAFSEASMAMPEHYPFTSGIQLHFEGGVIEHHFRAGGASFEEGEAQDVATLTAEGTPPEQLVIGDYDPFERQLDHFLQVVRNEEAHLLVTPADARRAVAVSDAINRSVQAGRRVEV